MFARVKTRWPDSRTAFQKPGLKNGARRREFYEDRNARISILAESIALKPRIRCSRLIIGALDQITCRRGGPYVFKSQLCLKAALRVQGAPRHAAEIPLLQPLADVALVRMNMESGVDAVTRPGASAPRHRS
jgi:hypothetical protein